MIENIQGYCSRQVIGALLIIIFVIPSVGVLAAPTPPADHETAVENSVVNIFATVRYPDLLKPWTKQAPQDLAGSGVILEGKRILCNAHVVLYASQVQIQASQAGDKVSATVEAIAPGMDLAVLKLEDESFFASHPPLPRARALPQIQDPVTVYGFPKGGTSLAIIKGTVSRIEFVPYNYPVSGLCIQIDAAINPGNSGGPVMAGGKMIGLVFSMLTGAQNVGYVIPSEEIDLFLEDIADGHYDGKPAMLDGLQTLENPALRPFLKLDRRAEGIIVHRPSSSDAQYPLKEWDLITRIGEAPVDIMGKVQIGSNLRVSLRYLVQKLAHNGKVPLGIVRAGRELHVDLPVSANHPTLLAAFNGGYPPYFVCGPLVFSTAASGLAASLALGQDGGAEVLGLAQLGSPLVRRLGDEPAFPGENLVLVSSPFFPHKLAKGYDNPALQVVKRVNNVPIRNLEHLVTLLRDSTDPFVTVEFYNRGTETLVFPRHEMLAATDEILAENGVRAQGSSDMLAIWNAKSPAAGALAVKQ